MVDQESEYNICIRDVYDRSGHPIKMIDIDGFTNFDIWSNMMKSDLHTHMKIIKNLEIRDEDVIINAYPKAGTHWVWEIIHMLRSKSTQYQNEEKEIQMLEMHDTFNTDLDTQPSPRVLNSHLWVKHLPKQIFEKKTKIIHLVRNPKDTAVSLYCQITGMKKIFGFPGNFDDFLYLFMYKSVDMGSIFDHIIQWENFVKTTDHPVYNMSYEDMIKNPKHHIKEIAQFLDIDVTDDFIHEVAQACSFRNLKKAKDDQTKDLFEEGTSLYRKGKVGDWKNHFTVAQNEEFDQVLTEKLKDIKIDFTYEL